MCFGGGRACGGIEAEIQIRSPHSNVELLEKNLNVFTVYRKRWVETWSLIFREREGGVACGGIEVEIQIRGPHSNVELLEQNLNVFTVY